MAEGLSATCMGGPHWMESRPTVPSQAAPHAVQGLPHMSCIYTRSCVQVRETSLVRPH